MPILPSLNRSRRSLGSSIRLCVAIAAGVAPLAAGAVRAEDPVATAVFVCKDDKSIDATFYSDKVDLKLSDGRTVTLPQAMSGSGARYANADETFVFWNKGDTAFVTEGADDKETFSDCNAKA